MDSYSIRIRLFAFPIERIAYRLIICTQNGTQLGYTSIYRWHMNKNCCECSQSTVSLHFLLVGDLLCLHFVYFRGTCAINPHFLLPTIFCRFLQAIRKLSNCLHFLDKVSEYFIHGPWQSTVKVFSRLGSVRCF